MPEPSPGAPEASAGSSVFWALRSDEVPTMAQATTPLASAEGPTTHRPDEAPRRAPRAHVGVQIANVEGTLQEGTLLVRFGGVRCSRGYNLGGFAPPPRDPPTRGASRRHKTKKKALRAGSQGKQGAPRRPEGKKGASHRSTRKPAQRLKSRFAPM